MEVNKVQVDISQGRIVGVENKLPNGLPFYSFKGIPYAEPPIGNLRFAVSENNCIFFRGIFSTEF